MTSLFDSILMGTNISDKELKGILLMFAKFIGFYYVIPGIALAVSIFSAFRITENGMDKTATSLIAICCALCGMVIFDLIRGYDDKWNDNGFTKFVYVMTMALAVTPVAVMAGAIVIKYVFRKNV